MAPLHAMPNFGYHGARYEDNKTKVKSTVKPILKRWSQSGKAKKSLDLDRGSDGQDEQGWGRSSSHSFYDQAVATPDVTADMTGKGAPAIAGVGLGVHASASDTQPCNHSRSTSGTSNASGTSNNNNNNNNNNGVPTPRQAGATFVHPFQQTPRTSTPPLMSYANSLASIADTRDYSPATITEDEDDDDEEDEISDSVDSSNLHSLNLTSYSSSGVQVHHSNLTSTSGQHSQPTLHTQLPTIPSKRTSSDTNLPKLPPHPPIRASTTSRIPSSMTQPSRLANIYSGSDLCLENITDLPASSSMPPTAITSPTSSIGPMSPLRTSLDGAFPRLRAKSDLDTSTRFDYVRAARRKYEMKERAKDEKYAREQIKLRERADNKRAHELEKRLATQHKQQLAAVAREEIAELEEALQRGKQNRKISMASSARPSLSMARTSLSLSRPSLTRRNTPAQIGEIEKGTSDNFSTAGLPSPPVCAQDAGATSPLRFTSSKRKSAARRKMQSAWTAFILWLRTHLLRLRKH